MEALTPNNGGKCTFSKSNDRLTSDPSSWFVFTTRFQVLNEVRPYLIADGGNVRVMGVDVESRVVSDRFIVRVRGNGVSQEGLAVSNRKGPAVLCRYLDAVHLSSEPIAFV